MNNLQVYKGDIYYVHKSEVTGSEYGGGRPAIIVGNDIGNEFSDVVMIVYLTTKEKKPLPTHVEICSSKVASTALCEQVFSVSKLRLGDYAGSITQEEMSEIDKALLVAFGINCDVNATKKLKQWEEMIEATTITAVTEKELESSDLKPEEPKPLPAPEKADVETDPKFIRACAERDIFKELYMDMIHRRTA